jgi:hypothetical protein
VKFGSPLLRICLFVGLCCGSCALTADGPDQSSASDGDWTVWRSGLVPNVLKVSWSHVGADQIEPSVNLVVTDFGAQPDDGRSDSQAFMEAIRAAGGDPAVISIPSGTFLLTETLHLVSGIVLRGQGPESRLEIDMADREGIGISGQGTAHNRTWQALGQIVERGSLTVVVPDPTAFSAGTVVELEQNNDQKLMITRPEWDVEWGEGSEGELAAVVGVEGNTITLSSPLITGYDVARNGRIRPLQTINDVGIESLSVHRVNTGYGDSISFQFASNVWVSDVVSSVTSRSHIGLDRVRGCTVEGSVIHDATDFGDGGRAYGISVARHTTSCLVINNTLYDLRHALIIQLGASGNVLAYNHARGSAGYEERRPQSDLSLHGHWPQRNLFEGNVFDRVAFGDWWGPAGPENTLLRNCVLESVIVADSSNREILAGNAIGPGGLTVENGIVGTEQIGNVIDGQIGEVRTIPVSLWTTVAPEFLSGTPWPPIDPDADLSTCKIPAAARSPWGS